MNNSIAIWLTSVLSVGQGLLEFLFGAGSDL